MRVDHLTFNLSYIVLWCAQVYLPANSSNQPSIETYAGLTRLFQSFFGIVGDLDAYRAADKHLTPPAWPIAHQNQRRIEK